VIPPEGRCTRAARVDGPDSLMGSITFPVAVYQAHSATTARHGRGDPASPPTAAAHLIRGDRRPISPFITTRWLKVLGG
jgi:hypothetical protein